MTDTLTNNSTKQSLNIESTQQALNMLRNLRQKRKKQNPASIYELVKTIYTHFKDQDQQPVGNGTGRKAINEPMISAGDYLNSNRESIQDMLAFVKNRITQTPITINSSNASTINPQAEQISRKKKGHIADDLHQSLTRKQFQIKILTESIKTSQLKSKQIQIKLLNNVKRLTTQVQQKDLKLGQYKKILTQKQSEVQQLTKYNEKQHKKIRKLQQDIYDLQLQLEQKNEQLEAEKQCADFLQRKVGKLLSSQSKSQIIHQEVQKEREADVEQSHCEVVSQCSQSLFPSRIFHHVELVKSEIATQTDLDESQQQNSNSNGNESDRKYKNRNSHEILQNQNQSQSQQHETSFSYQNEDKMSQNSSVLTQSKQSKYIESIERLTFELGQAYQRINQLMKQDQIGTGIDMNSEHIQIQTHAGTHIQALHNNGVKINRDKVKSKSKSGYFSKFWK